jgi:hypothetical protein
MKTALVAVLAVLPLLAAPPLHADRLTDLRATLQKLKGDAPVRAQIAVRDTRKGGDEDEQKIDSEEATVLAEQGPQGLKLTWSPQLIEEARKASWQRAANPEATTSRGAGLSVLDAGQAVALLDAADPLLLEIDRATLVEDKVEPRGGKPTRVLVLKPREGFSAAQRKSLKSREDVLKIWLDDAGIPVALDRQVQLKYSKLLISFRVSTHATRTYAVVGDHLIATAASDESSGAGLGQSGENHKLSRVTVLP